ncbi:MAG TPA: 4Fe-4S dicluster domain-containing protein [Roseiflexaceae bacterium]|jgi:ferredoxin|nr:4Fe-4S dicluster domain-containing protein [Roseiflexaceae bacterium]
MKADTTRWQLPLVDAARCTGCGICVARCPTGAVEVHNGRAVIVRPWACTFCEVCESSCPTGAIGRPFTIVFAPDAASPPNPADL